MATFVIIILGGYRGGLSPFVLLRSTTLLTSYFWWCRLPSSVKPSNCNNLCILLHGLLSSYRQSRVLRSSTSDLLSTQSSSTNIAARRFSCCAPTVWNSLPSFVRTADSFTSFSSQLKTYMFARHYVAGPLSAPLIPLNRFSVRYKCIT